MSKLQWGILSTAQIGLNKAIPGIQRSASGEVAAIASRGEERAVKAAADLSIPRAYGSYEALLADPAVEAVYNPLPNHLHVPWTIKALEAGKHVLCEKPIAITKAEAATLKAAADRSGRLVAEAFMVRHHPQWRLVREIAASGRLGEVRAIQTLFAYHNPDPANIRNQADIGGGGLLDIGCYAVATARFLFGAEPERAIAAIDRDPALGVDRMTSGLVVFRGARQLGFTVATQIAKGQRVEILGTRARITMLVPFNAPHDRAVDIVVDDGTDLFGAGAETISVAPADQFTLQADAFAAAVRGEAPLEWGLDDALANMAVLDALFRSAETSTWERP
ncbi:Gfo/Idh/MocA family protein [Acuticoccus sediminis]|uniref:Gfo/Idh/MocA family protein n=1 Tax=Acuticoccus sediminis TaxID=2184697 RepID=UPI001CFD59CB|nr:Gfo/Idh/MocA family oxidoreductase [Acuticoccus sediminis]